MDWKQIYLLPRLITFDSYSRSFQYQILNNVLYLDKKLFKLWKRRHIFAFLQTFWWDSSPSVLRMQYNSKSMEWTRFILRKRIHYIWSKTAGCLLGFLNVESKLLLIQNNLLLIFKIYIYNSRRSESLKIKSLIREITKVKRKNFIKQWKKNMLYKRENGN